MLVPQTLRWLLIFWYSQRPLPPQPLHRFFRRPCSQKVLPPQSLHWLLIFWCSQRFWRLFLCAAPSAADCSRPLPEGGARGAGPIGSRVDVERLVCQLQVLTSSSGCARVCWYVPPEAGPGPASALVLVLLFLCAPPCAAGYFRPLPAAAVARCPKVGQGALLLSVCVSASRDWCASCRS